MIATMGLEIRAFAMNGPAGVGVSSRTAKAGAGSGRVIGRITRDVAGSDRVAGRTENLGLHLADGLDHDALREIRNGR